MWVPPEENDPVVYHAPTRKNIGYFGAVCASDGRFTTVRINTFNAETFLAFLKILLRRRRSGKKMVVVVDNARWHHAKKLAPWLHEHRKVLRLDFLPPYSPDLNPIERVWKLTRRLCTHNRYFQELEELIQMVDGQFKKWHKSNATLRRLCAVI